MEPVGQNAELALRPLRLAPHVDAGDEHSALRRPEQAGDHRERRRLPRTVRADDAGERPGVERERHVVDGEVVAVLLRERFEDEDRSSSRNATRRASRTAFRGFALGASATDSGSATSGSSASSGAGASGSTTSGSMTGRRVRPASATTDRARSLRAVLFGHDLLDHDLRRPGERLRDERLRGRGGLRRRRRALRRAPGAVPACATAEVRGVAGRPGGRRAFSAPCPPRRGASTPSRRPSRHPDAAGRAGFAVGRSSSAASRSSGPASRASPSGSCVRRTSRSRASGGCAR